MSESKLKPCPFCGGEVREWKSDTPVSFSLFDVFHKRGCFLDKLIPKCFYPHLLAAWNRRVK